MNLLDAKPGDTIILRNGDTIYIQEIDANAQIYQIEAMLAGNSIRWMATGQYHRGVNDHPWDIVRLIPARHERLQPDVIWGMSEPGMEPAPCIPEQYRIDTMLRQRHEAISCLLAAEGMGLVETRGKDGIFSLSLHHFPESALRKAQKFKTFVHGNLSFVGVPEDPYPEHTQASGCRIAGRLQWLYEKWTLEKRAIEMLRLTEWSPKFADGMQYCDICKNFRSHGHAETCEIKAILKAAE